MGFFAALLLGPALAGADDTLVFADEVPTTLNPLYAEAPADWRAGELVFERLFYLCAICSEPRSDLVDRYERRGTDLVLTLKEGRRFTDGKPVTAADLCFSVNVVVEPRNPIPWADPFRKVLAGCDVAGKNAVVHFTERVADGRHWLEIPVLPAYAFSSTVVMPEHPFRDHPVGSRGFVATRTTDGVRYDAVKASPFALRHLESHAPGPDLVDDLRAGRLDGAIELPFGVADQLGDLALKSWNPREMWLVDVDPARVPDVAIRRALDQVLDRQALAAAYDVLPDDPYPRLELVSGPVPQASPCYNRTVAVTEPAPADAKKVLAGLSFTVAESPAASTRMPGLADALVAQLRAAGVSADRVPGNAHLTVDHLVYPHSSVLPELLARYPDRVVIGPTDEDVNTACRGLHADLHDQARALFLWSGGRTSAWSNDVRGNVIEPGRYWGNVGRWQR